MPDALINGALDAVIVPEPFLTMLKDQVAFPGWHTELDRKLLEQSGELFQRYDILKRPPYLDQLVWK